jgi:hypothetical protein
MRETLAALLAITALVAIQPTLAGLGAWSPLGSNDDAPDLSACHDGFWVAEADDLAQQAIIVINDTHYDPETRRTTVYAQTRTPEGMVLAPPQLSRGECAPDASGETVCFHPNAVYLNGGGEELDAEDGSGAWWVKHSWIVNGPGYYNCPLSSEENYNCIWAKGRLLDDGLTMKLSGVNLFTRRLFNLRKPLIDQEPLKFEVARYTGRRFAATEPDFVVSFECSEEPGPLDDQVRPCPDSVGSVCQDLLAGGDDDDGPAPRVGFELLQIVSPGQIKAWASDGPTQAEFDAIELSFGWFKNQPRELDPDTGMFARSPDALIDGEFSEQEMYGHVWRHVATIVDANIALDTQGLLTGSHVRKFHEVTFNAGKTLTLLVSPEGENYVRISRDYLRTTDQPSIPNGWQQVDYVTPGELVVELPDETLVIRADNEDSFQGPLPQLDIDP